MLKKMIFFSLILYLLIGNKTVIGQDWWVKKLPMEGIALFMLEVDDGYMCLANVGRNNSFVLTLFKYSKTGDLIWYKQYPPNPPYTYHFPGDFIKTVHLNNAYL